jgi:hypothetical protein
MKKRCFAALLIFFAFSLLGFSQSQNTKQIFSLDTGYLAKGIKNNGWGIGFTYEREIFRGIAVKGGLSHMTMWMKNPKMVLTSVGITGEILYYPFLRGLDWLYFGYQCKTGFFMYNGTSINEENNQDCVISLYPLIGWKQSFFDIVMIDIFGGYRFVVNPQDQKGIIKDQLKNNFEYGIKVKFSLGKIIQFFKDNNTRKQKRKLV